MNEDQNDYSNFNIKIDIVKNKSNDILVNGRDRNYIMKNNPKFFNYYEYVAEPRLILDNNKLNFTSEQIERIIKETFTCSFCMDIFNEPVNIKNCLHKFCKKCIENYTRTTKKECIICREKIETRRVLRDDEKIKSLISCVIPNVNSYSEAIDDFFKKNLKNFCLNDDKKKKIKEELIKKTEKKINNNHKQIINLDCAEIKKDNAILDKQQESNNIRGTEKITVAVKEGNVNINDKNNSASKNDNLVCNLEGSRFKDLDTNRNSLNSLVISRKTNRIESESDPIQSYEPNKKSKIEKEICQYDIPLEQAEKHIKDSNNILGVKLICEKEATCIFHNLKLYTSQEMSLEEFSIYILHKKTLNYNLTERLNFYIYHLNRIIELNKKLSIRQIRESYKMDPENVTIYFYFK